jgi:hypothetical protein
MSAATQRRRDLHNVTIDFALAAAGLCGFTHMRSGRVCRLPHRHPGPCELRSRPADTTSMYQQRPG